jgi:hypothetical protein
VTVEGGIAGTVAVSSVAGTVATTQVENLAGLNIAAGRISGTDNNLKFGSNIAIPTTFKPITRGGIYPMMQVGGAIALRVKAGNTNDTAAGSGAQEVTLIGLVETGAEATVTLATAGTSASSATSETFIRLYRAYVSKSGTYATVSGATSGSQAADIVIEDSGGAGDWCTIPLNVFGMAQTNIGAFTVPLGKTAYMKSWLVQADSAKAVDFLFYSRENILETSAPYSALRVRFGPSGVSTFVPVKPDTPAGPFPALTDMVFMGRVGADTGSGSVDFEIILEDA